MTAVVEMYSFYREQFVIQAGAIISVSDRKIFVELRSTSSSATTSTINV